MKLDFIPLDKLCISKANMRWSKKAPDVSDILPTVRKRGVIQPVIVRPCPPPAGEPGSDAPDYEIVAGSRRFHAACTVWQEKRAAGDADAECAALPCAILDDGDDADAIEASLIENSARRDPGEVAQWEAFTRLVKEGRTIDDIAATFGLPEIGVRRVLALGNLLPRIRQLYAREEIDRATVRHLTLASKSQQRAWLALFDDEDAYAPNGHQLKAWLLCRARHNTHYADRVIMPRMSCQSAFVRGLWFTPVGIIASSRGQVLPARASMARSLSEGGLNRPGFTPGGAWAARIANFSTGSARK